MNAQELLDDRSDAGLYCSDRQLQEMVDAIAAES